MSSINILFEARPYKPGTGGVTVRLSSAYNGDGKGTQLDGYEWNNLIVSGPSYSLNYTSDRDGRLVEAVTELGNLAFRIGSFYDNEEWATYEWNNASCRLWIGESGQPFSAYRKLYEATCSGLERDGVTASLTLRALTNRLAKPLLNATYAGTGGAEGPTTKKGTVKPIAIGHCLTVDPVTVDAARWIFQVHGYGPVQDIEQVYDFAQPVGKLVASVNTYAELAAVELKPAEWAKCNPLGMFRLGGASDKKISADVQGALFEGAYLNTVSDIVPALIRLAGFDASKVGSFASLPNKGWSFYSTSEADIVDVARKAVLDGGGYLFTDNQGVWQVGNAFAPKTAKPLRADGSEGPTVISVRELNVADPITKVLVGYDPCWNVHSNSDISPKLLEMAGTIAEQDEALKEVRDTADRAKAQSEANRIEINNIAADGIMDRGEKVDQQTALEKTNAERREIASKITMYQVGSAWTDYVAAYEALKAYLVPILADMNVASSIERATFVSRWATYTEKHQAVWNAMAGDARTVSTWTGVSGAGKPQDNADVTSQNTSKDTAAVGGVPASTVTNALKDSAGNIVGIREIQSNIATANERIKTAQDTATKAGDDLAKEISDRDAGDRHLQSQFDTFINDSANGDTYARSEINTLKKTVADGDKSLGERIDVVKSSVTRGGGNLLSNTDFATLDGWNVGGNSANGTLGRNLTDAYWRPGGVEDVLNITQGPSTENAAHYTEVFSDPFAVRPSAFYQFYIYGSSHRALNWVTLFYYRADGSFLGYAGEYMAPNRNNGGRDIADWDQNGAKYVKAPADAVMARMVLRKYDTLPVEGTDSVAWFWHPYVGEATEGQTIWNAYVSGNAKAVQLRSDAEIKTAQRTGANAEQAVATLDSTVGTRFKGVNDTLADHDTRIVTVSNESGSTVSRANTLEAQMRRETPSPLNTYIDGVNGRIDSVNSATVTNLNARIEERAAAYADDRAGAVAGRAATLEAQMRREAPSVLNNAVNDVNGRIDTVNTTNIDYTNARIEERAQAWATQEAGAVATRANTLEAQMRREVPSAINNYVDAVNGRIDSVNGTTITNLNARIEDRASAWARQESGAVAQTVQNLRAEYNQTKADLSTVSGVASDAYGRSRAFLQQTAVANGNRAQLTLYADSNGGGGVDIVGDVRIGGNLVVDGSITSSKYAPSSVQQVAFQTLSYDMSVPRGGGAPGNPNPYDPGPGYDPDYPIP